MAGKPIQEQFGETIIAAVRQFARADLQDVPALEFAYFTHVSDLAQRKVLAETLYGARWIYKLGLALLVKDEEQLAHVRAQIIDYAAICEGLLHSMITHAIHSGIMQGQKYRFADAAKLARPITWPGAGATVAAISDLAGKQAFYWRIAVSADEAIIDGPLATKLHKLRTDRNSVHLHARTYPAYLSVSRNAFNTLTDAIAQTRAWKNAHP